MNYEHDDKPLVEIPSDAPIWKRLPLRLFRGLLALEFALRVILLVVGLIVLVVLLAHA